MKQPIDLANREVNVGKKGVLVSNVEVILHYYGRSHGQYKFKYDLTDSQWISLESIITNVILTFNPETQVYTLDRDDVDNLNKYVTNNRIE